MATRVKEGVNVSRTENASVVRNHKGHDVNVAPGSVVLATDSGHVVVLDSDTYDAVFEEAREESRDSYQ